MKQRKTPKRPDWRVPSAVAVAASYKTGSGKHGGSAQANNRRDRRAARLANRDL